MRLKILSANIAGLKDDDPDFDSFVDLLTQGYDIVLL